MHGRLSAKEELQNIAGTPETQRTPHPLRIPPPLTFHDHNGKKNSILGYELVHAIQILDRHGSHVQNLYRMYKLVSDKVVITAFKMHKKVAVGSFFIGWYPSYILHAWIQSSNVQSSKSDSR